MLGNFERYKYIGIANKSLKQMKIASLVTSVTLLVVWMACSPSSESKEPSEEKPQVVEEGREAKTRVKAALWSSSELEMLNSQDNSDLKASTYLSRDVTVYVLNLGEKYAKVITLYGTEGYIGIRRLSPVEQSYRDSTDYLGAKEMGKINTYVDGMDVGKVNLWKNWHVKDKVVTSVGKGEKVAILREQDRYLQVATITGDAGWCLKDFVKR